MTKVKRIHKKKSLKRASNISLLLLFLVLFAITSAMLLSIAHLFMSGEERILMEEGMGKSNEFRWERNAESGGETNTYSIEEALEEMVKKGVPSLFQWDSRWSDKIYGAGPMETTGCGPTCLSMVAMYLLGNAELTPAWMADFSTEHGFCVPGNGTSWSFMSEGASMLGLQVDELPVVESTIRANLKEGNPIICIMGPGIFTDKGHFLVLAGWEDGKIRLNDPNSRENSEKLWDYREIESQIRGMWVYYK